jgi:hypothetical protein
MLGEAGSGEVIDFYRDDDGYCIYLISSALKPELDKFREVVLCIEMLIKSFMENDGAYDNVLGPYYSKYLRPHNLLLQSDSKITAGAPMTNEQASLIHSQQIEKAYYARPTTVGAPQRMRRLREDASPPLLSTRPNSASSAGRGAYAPPSGLAASRASTGNRLNFNFDLQQRTSPSNPEVNLFEQYFRNPRTSDYDALDTLHGLTGDCNRTSKGKFIYNLMGFYEQDYQAVAPLLEGTTQSVTELLEKNLNLLQQTLTQQGSSHGPKCSHLLTESAQVFCGIGKGFLAWELFMILRQIFVTIQGFKSSYNHLFEGEKSAYSRKSLAEWYERATVYAEHGLTLIKNSLINVDLNKLVSILEKTIYFYSATERNNKADSLRRLSSELSKNLVVLTEIWSKMPDYLSCFEASQSMVSRPLSTTFSKAQLEGVVYHLSLEGKCHFAMPAKPISEIARPDHVDKSRALVRASTDSRISASADSSPAAKRARWGWGGQRKSGLWSKLKRSSTESDLQPMGPRT